MITRSKKINQLRILIKGRNKKQLKVHKEARKNEEKEKESQPNLKNKKLKTSERCNLKKNKKKLMKSPRSQIKNSKG